MKKIFFGFLISFVIGGIPNELKAQTKGTVTDTLTVSGNCGQCKTRIEEAAYIKGVKLAEWNKQTKILKVVHLADKASLDQISQSVSHAGHDTRLHTADNKSYGTLPSCCAYRTGSCHHE